MIGVLPELMIIAAARDGSLPFARLLTARQNLVERVTLIMLEMASVTGEMDCENERSVQLRNPLQKSEERRLCSLAVAALVRGAATAIITGGIALRSPDAASANMVSVLGGPARIYHAVLYVNGIAAHARNLLIGIWNGELGSTAYPGSIWRFLNYSRDGPADAPFS